MTDKEMLKEAISWAWVPCDQTVACPWCGVAWWGTEGELEDDWHEPGCKFQEFLVTAGASTGKRVDQGEKAFESTLHRPDTLKVVGIKRLREAWVSLYQLVPWDAIDKKAHGLAEVIGNALRPVTKVDGNG